jgi:hypothetical protein
MNGVVMKIAIGVAIVVIIGPSFVVRLSGQQRAPEGQRRTTIEVGQTIDDAEAILRDHRIEISADGLELAQSNADVGNVLCVLDKRNAWATISYSKEMRAIIDISMIFFPQDKPQKATRIWMPAKSISFDEHAGYSVLFLPTQGHDR